MPRRTIAKEIEAEGVALHAGTRVRMTLAPAEPGAGVLFHRSDLGGRAIIARYDRVGETRLGTVVDDGAGASVGLTEAVAGLGDAAATGATSQADSTPSPTS